MALTFRSYVLTALLAPLFASVAFAAVPDPCSLLTPAEASAFLGGPAKSSLDQDAKSNNVACTWTSGSAFVKVRMETDDILAACAKAHPGSNVLQTAGASFAEVKKGGRPSVHLDVVAVTGVGQDAVWVKNLGELWVLKGKKLVVVTVNHKLLFAPADDLPGAKAVAAKVVPKL